LLEIKGRRAKELWDKGFGEYFEEEEKLILSDLEIVYLSGKGLLKEEAKEAQLKKIKKTKGFQELFKAYSFLREKGYSIRTGAEAGEDLRVYEKGIRRGEGKSKYVVHVIDKKKFNHESLSFAIATAQRIRRELLLALVEEKGEEVVFFKVGRVRF